MPVTFLLGPAGSGKTFRCLAEIREALQASPEGPPLLLLAPKQATFQLERQLLADPALPGYTRLQILSFERLAGFILGGWSGAPPNLLGDEGRVMVLRALLAQRQPDLRLFRATARLPGFAQQLSLLLREVQRHQLSPDTLAPLAEKPGLSAPLAAKLHDLALLLRAYLDWLRDHQLQDASGLLDLATNVLRDAAAGSKVQGPRSKVQSSKSKVQGPEFEAQGSKFKVQGSPPEDSAICNPQSAIRNLPSAFRTPHSAFHLGGLWLDGFAEMTPQELDLLAALLPRCARATLAFCLDHEPADELPWLSTWSVVAQSFRQCRARIEAVPGCQPVVELLPRRADRGRFSASPALAHLEQHWTNPPPPSSILHPPSSLRDLPSSLRLALCANPEAEATLAAREVLQHVRAGGRFRECAVLVRSLDGCHDVLRRVFQRYEIPFFLDRREPVAHHPLAELTRSALRSAAFGWQHDDWFGALKTGLVPASDDEIDRLENAALACGWEGPAWREPLRVPEDEHLSQSLEPLRQRLVPPFLQLASAAAAPLTGAALAEALREFWNALDIEATLNRWSEPPPDRAPSAFRHPQSALHATVWQQMQAWLANLERAFPHDAPPLPLREWLPILEAGLAGLTVGVIPPALDQVLIGAIDRSRNPDLQLALVLGLNEGVFPAPPPPAVLLTDADRDELESHRVFLGPNRHLRLGHERYFGYIACTRASRRLVLTCAACDDDAHTLNPSLFLDHVRRLFPQLTEEKIVGLGAPAMGTAEGDSAPPPWLAAEHACELAAPLLRNKTLPPAARVPSLAALETMPVFAPLVAKWTQLFAAPAGKLSPAVAERLFGQELSTSVSALEEYAACPFKFFVARGLRAEERKRFEIDERERGSFQHEALKEFQGRLRNQGRRWRDVSVVEACVMIRNIGDDLRAYYRHGLFQASAAGRFHAQLLITQLDNLIAVLIEWARHYEFDPLAAEVAFGFPEAPLPAWRLPLDAGHALLLRGRIDRIDFCLNPDADEALAAVIDYKSTVRPLDATKLHHGLQLQLLSYLGVLRHLEKPRETMGVARVVPAGVFYVGLRGGGGSGATRAEVLAGREDARQSGYQHTGRFNAAFLRQFDNRPDATAGDQFKYRLNKDGSLHGQNADAMPAEAFSALLDSVEGHLRRIGREIFAGETKVSPFRKNTETACQYCEFRAICRFDPWVEPYRVLRPPVKAEKQRKLPDSNQK